MRARVLLIVAALLVPSAWTAARAPKITDLLTLYLNGDFAAAMTPLAASIKVRNVAIDLEVDGGEWVDKGATPAEIERRRFAAAAMALEFAVLRREEDWQVVRPLIEWGCALLRKGPPSERERAFQRASLIAIQGARDTRFARRQPPLASILPAAEFSADHIVHVMERFPDDPLLLFTLGFFEEFQVPVEGNLRTIDVDTAARASARAIEVFRRAAEDPALTHEAALHIGYLHLRTKKLDAVLPELGVAAQSSDPFVRYLAHLLRGRTLEALGGKDDAAEAYRAALAVIPNAQSAAISLAAVLHRGEQADQAIDVMSASFAARPAVDPWREFGYGRFRLWKQARDAMREAVR